MNNKEAINIISQMIKDGEGFLCDNTIEAFKMAIKALGQEPCDDAINREDALMCLTGELKETDTIETIIARFIKRLKSLPPVNPQTNTGHWIDTDEGVSPCKCSECEIVELKKVSIALIAVQR